MIVLDVEQGSPEWVEARLGIPTASAFSRILTQKTMRLSAQADKYLHELLVEWALGVPARDFSTGFTERGSELEDQAAQFYELTTDRETTKVGFVTNDEGSVGASPDRLVGDDGLVEIKCYGATHHIETLLKGPAAHDAQMQGQMWICERKWCDLVVFHPELPSHIARVARDEEYIARLHVAIVGFVERLATAKVVLAGHGVTGAAERRAAQQAQQEAEDKAWMERMLTGNE